MSRLIAIASGKGGVGKTLITAALAVQLQRRGRTVLAVDADMGLGNLDLLFGLEDAVRYDASQAVRGKCLPAEALLHVLPGLDLLPASRKRTWEKLDGPSYEYVVESLSGNYDYTLIDCPPGRAETYKAATALADELLFVVEPSPSSLRDAAKVRQYCQKQGCLHDRIILNNFYADGSLTPEDVKSSLQTGQLAGLLPHDERIEALAAVGAMKDASQDLPFCRALTATAAFLETGEAVPQTRLECLLPYHGVRRESTFGLSLRHRRQESRNWRHYRR